MALAWADRVLETTVSTGTGPFALAAAILGFQRFSAACSINDTIYYCVFAVDTNGNPSGDWETGLGTYSSANTLTRTTVSKSSNANNAVNFAAGTKWVMACPIAAVLPSAFALTLLDDADAPAMRSTLGLGAAALLSASDVDERARDAVMAMISATGLLTETENDGSDTDTLTVPAATTTEVLTGTGTTQATTPDSVAALWEQGSDVASAGTVSLGEGGYFVVTGTTTITDIDFATDKAGRKAWVKFAGALTLTHNASTLILPTGANIATAAGDTACFVSEGSDAVRCVAYSRASGQPLVSGSLTMASTVAQSGTPAANSVGFLGAPQMSDQDDCTLALADSGGHYYHVSGTPHTLTIPANASIAFPIGTVIAIVNENGAGTLSLAITSDTLRWGSSTGSRSIAANGSATLLKVTSTVWRLTGDGIT